MKLFVKKTNDWDKDYGTITEYTETTVETATATTDAKIKGYIEKYDRERLCRRN